MKRFVKENRNQILFLIFLGLILILWGRLFFRHFYCQACTQKLTTLEERVRCAEYYGWQVDRGSETKTTVYLPQEPDAVHNRYNQLQRLSGFDLTPYYGKGVVRYTFRVLNFPGREGQEAFLNLLAYEASLIGGDCMIPALAGEMLPLKRN